MTKANKKIVRQFADELKEYLIANAGAVQMSAEQEDAPKELLNYTSKVLVEVVIPIIDLLLIDWKIDEKKDSSD